MRVKMNPDDVRTECPVCGEEMDEKEHNFDKWLECHECHFTIYPKEDFTDDQAWK
jgi:ssDNA-binding Zn-finger/Zn-ribbon topoisomerase 1